MTSDSKDAQRRLQSAAEGNPSDFLQEVLRQASTTVLLLGDQLEAEKKKSQALALALELERRQQPPPPSIHDAIRVLVQTYQTCGRCKSWEDYDRSQTDDLGRCREAKHPDNRKNFLSTEDELETRSDFSCSFFTPRS